MAEQSDKGGGQRDAYRGEQTGFQGYGFGGFPSRAEAAIEHDEDQCYGADVSNHPAPLRCKPVILASAQKTEHQEEQQDRNPELSGKLIEEYADDDYRREYQKVQCHMRQKYE